METERKDLTDNGLFTMSRLGPGELTHQAIEDYLSKGRHMHSVYVVDVFMRLWRLLGALLVRSGKWLNSTLNGIRAALAERLHGLSHQGDREINRRCGPGKWDETRSCRPFG